MTEVREEEKLALQQSVMKLKFGESRRGDRLEAKSEIKKSVAEF
jgi:hypothetical protein